MSQIRVLWGLFISALVPRPILSLNIKDDGAPQLFCGI